MSESAHRLRVALDAPGSSDRLQAALTAGTRPNPDQVRVLVDRCAIEPDFYVRDMLTWALTRHSAETTIPLLFEAIQSDIAQARSQALHTLSKIGDPRGWQAITPELLHDSDDQTARTAWRAAAVLAPDQTKPDLAVTLTTQLGRGNREMQLSLSRALVALGEAADAALANVAERSTGEARRHAIATQRLARDPDEGFDTALFEAKRTPALTDSATPPAEASGAPT